MTDIDAQQIRDGDIDGDVFNDFDDKMYESTFIEDFGWTEERMNEIKKAIENA